MQFEVPSHNSRLLWYVLIMALLVHIGMMMVFVVHYDTGAYSTLQLRDMYHVQQQDANAEVEQSSDVWVNRKAAPSQFGAPVVFYDEPEQAESMCEELVEGADPLAQNVQHDVNHEEADRQELAQDLSDDVKHQEVTQQQSGDQQVVETPKRDSEQPGDITAVVEVAEQNIQKTSNTEQSRQEQRTPPTKLMRQNKIKSKKVPVQQGSAKQKNGLTLAQLAQGFLQYAQQEEGGDALLEVRGGRDGVPTDEQLKHERYQQKIAWLLQRELQMKPFVASEFPEPPFVVGWELLLNRDGSIHELVLLASSGNPVFDEKYAKIIWAASSSFPPVPHFFKDDVYSICFYCRVDAKAKASRIKFSAR
ncbi:TonB C-terminal domain-containing protein [Candidatus Dependentiae bacterium]|nr:TonB C-terminal domain-containing protein [Candidatus Dependentiae bacterium]